MNSSSNLSFLWFEQPHLFDKKRNLQVIIASITFGLSLNLWAQTGVIDQSNEVFYPPSLENINYFYPMGQEFRPALNSLSFIDLMIWDFFGQGSGPGNLQVNVRSDTINGPIIGTSSILILQRGFQGIAHFDFPGIVPLNPGSLYVMSPRVVDGGDWGVGASGLNAYPDGQKIRMGAFVPGDDLFFREGTVVVPEPTSAAFLVLGLVVVIGWRRFYYSRRSPVSAARLLPNSQGVQWCSSRHL